ncbi:hypothetical protein FJZ27_05045 [Candidatus Peribacteria bacterium]|nr:hypothetical protein [Candidatus Peribacteria bacterium]
MRRADRISAFVEALWDWYAANKRTLPWRDLSESDPVMRAYKVMVSEIMLQQTQVSRVKIMFKDFIDLFPNIESLALASNREVLLAWRGMGYNSRALRLRDAARMILKAESCQLSAFRSFPSEVRELRSIPGIGSYTAAAIRNFALGIPTPCIDTNIRRILHRTFVGPESPDGTWEKDDGYLLKIADDVLHAALNTEKLLAFGFQLKAHGIPQDAAQWHAALMDFGSLVQTKRNPRWDICPLTAKGIMKTTLRSFEQRALSSKSGSKLTAHSLKLEPGRYVGSRFVPNRIFRGKVVEELRDAKQLSLDDIGRRICLDWSPREHRKWLRGILDKLEKDRMLKKQGGTYAMSEDDE